MKEKKTVYKCECEEQSNIKKSQPWSFIAGLSQLWRHIIVLTVLTQEVIPEEGGIIIIFLHYQ